MSQVFEITANLSEDEVVRRRQLNGALRDYNEHLDAVGLGNVARSQFRIGNIGAAMEAAQMALALSETASGTAYKILAAAHELRGEIGDVHETCLRWRNCRSADPWGYYYLARTQELHFADPEGALESLVLGLHHNPGSPCLNLQRAEVLYRLGRPDEALVAAKLSSDAKESKKARDLVALLSEDSEDTQPSAAPRGTVLHFPKR